MAACMEYGAVFVADEFHVDVEQFFEHCDLLRCGEVLVA